MKSIKLKITMWISVFVIIISLIFLFLANAISTNSANKELDDSLVNMVTLNSNEIDFEDGNLEIDDFISFRQGVYSAVYSIDGELLFGNTPVDEVDKVKFTDGDFILFKYSEEDFLIYNRKVYVEDYGDVWVRAIAADRSSLNTNATYNSMLRAIPILIVLAIFGGYSMANKSLKPIKDIGITADEIAKSGDLTKRIEVGVTDDEINTLMNSFNHMFDKLENNFESERRFTSDASHELRNPIATILAQCEYAIENADTKGDLKDSILSIQRQGLKMKSIVESLLEVTRIEQGTKNLRFERVNLSKLAKNIAEEYSSQGMNWILSTDIREEIYIKADERLINRLISNLLENAHKYCNSDCKVNLSLIKNSNRAILKIEDNGIGISEKDMEKIWNRFYRADESRTQQSKPGLGLGLSMVKQIALIHNGIVNVDSKLGEWSIFTIEIPLDNN